MNHENKMSSVGVRSLRAYRGIGSITEATREQLGMFDGVCGQVHLQASSICVTTVTVVTLVRLVFVVLPTVRLYKEEKRLGKIRIFNLLLGHWKRKKKFIQAVYFLRFMFKHLANNKHTG